MRTYLHYYSVRVKSKKFYVKKFFAKELKYMKSK